MGKSILYISFCVCAIIQGCSKSNGLPDMRENFNYRSSRPFGCSIAYKLLQASYPDNIIQVKTKTLYENILWSSDTGSVYINISRNFYLEPADANALIDFVNKGNTAIIASTYFDSLLLDKLYCKVQYKTFSTLNTTFSSLVPALRNIDDSFHRYYYYPFSSSFADLRNAYCRIAGYNEFHEPNFIVFFLGKGRLYLHCDPRAFSNYFLLQGNNYQYLLQPLSVLPTSPEHIFWDDHYNKLNYRTGSGGSSLLNTIFKNPPLKWVFWLSLILLLFYIFLNGKRRQRIIPVTKPVQNSSVAFAEAIAGLYYKEKDNKTIVDKMLNYFNEFIRTRYFLNPANADDEFLLSLSKKAEVSLEETQQLFQTIRLLSTQNKISDLQLLSLNDQIHKFNKSKK